MYQSIPNRGLQHKHTQVDKTVSYRGLFTLDEECLQYKLFGGRSATVIWKGCNPWHGQTITDIDTQRQWDNMSLAKRNFTEMGLFHAVYTRFMGVMQGNE